MILGHIRSYVGNLKLYQGSETIIKSPTELNFSGGIISIKLK